MARLAGDRLDLHCRGIVGIDLSLARMGAARGRSATGRTVSHVLWRRSALIVGLPLLAFSWQARRSTFEYPELKGFNFRGGMTVIPEFMALLLALSIYTASFIAEIVRAGIHGGEPWPDRGGAALGLRPGQTLGWWSFRRRCG